MRDYLGKRDASQESSDSEENAEYDSEVEGNGISGQSARGYDLIYILDAIYHFPPSVPYFLATALPALRPGTGVLAYTDILPPPNLNAALGHLILPTILGVPARNLMQRPKDLDGYKENLEKIGYERIVVEDWSDGVWEGFATKLKERGGLWEWVGRGITAAEKGGWRFIAVKARRPALS